MVNRTRRPSRTAEGALHPAPAKLPLNYGDKKGGRRESAPNWPRYNIEKTGADAFRITMAVAGFAPEEIDSRRRTLFVSGQKHPEPEGGI